MAETSDIHPVILCGGSGTRLWPLSRRSRPKQFADLLGDETLFQASIRRVAAKGFAAPMVVTADDYRFVVTEQLDEIGVTPRAVVIEPAARNTAPAILAAARLVAARDPEAVMLVLPSDHAIPDAAAFRAAVAEGLAAARDGRLVTFGIRPDRPETGYGYLELAPGGGDGAQPLRGFVEKPDAERAAVMLAEGHYLWNAGIFLFRADAVLAAFAAHCPDLVEPVAGAVDAAEPDLSFLRLDAAAWSGARDISIDHAVMEKAENLSVVPFAGAWSDLGDWQALWRVDGGGTVTHGDVVAIDCAGSLLRAEREGQVLVGIGLTDIVAVSMGDAVLIADRNRAQDVKLAVDRLKAEGLPQAHQHPIDYRPWGYFESLAQGDRFQVKRITVKPGQSLSLQSHHHRSEHWIVVQGTARVTIDDAVHLVSENQSVYIPLGAVHRMENPGKLDMVLIEVQTGSYLGEDDITRYEDVYARK
ncbi:mannose-1-phosphate guanylyltransferase/mannose-6-phosphate isomerase [Jannaschia ovalis]|uniref:mannose-1-phosphate guanylyltransferase n=1 Tax=Jannaschia ovalis TaxID=3038773 RepID=A0ABY8LFY9_9RHOB|nr:mannose-1-phosphate guanylyltransferase/mannose-6-phosphate isomerase [Jannaschia sp. GRR-S6-38]WGH80198.1 mannose-1-phosphate guanylyltransferase/mannose-6-phosphate isomerase [Jannaschia sp. GRR-S6-38]